MKKLSLFVALIVIIGIGGFWYRNALEKPSVVGKVCTTEAKVCPDGTLVRRTEPMCEFEKCAPPNIVLSKNGISFTIPTGFVKALEVPNNPDLELIASYYWTDLDAPGDEMIKIHQWEIPKDTTANALMMEKTIFSPKDEKAQSMEDFAKVQIGTHSFYRAIVERFEGYVHVVYFFPRANNILEFEALDRNVLDWTDADLAIDKLPAHAALLSLLDSLQITP